MSVSPQMTTAINCHTEEPTDQASRQYGVGFSVIAALVYIASFAATIYFCFSMSGGMDMPGDWTMSMMWMRMPGQSWLESAAMFQLMWLAMMVAMMLPSAMPMLLSFRRTLAGQGIAMAEISTVLAACGYFTLWTAIGVVVYLMGISWAFATMHWSVLSRTVPTLTGVALILAGTFQFSRWKMSGLGDCHNPLTGIQAGKRNALWSGWSYGFHQGVFCGGCCSGLMLILLVLGSMNLIVMFVVAVVISLEKLLSKPQPVVYGAGIACVCSGLAIVLKSLL